MPGANDPMRESYPIDLDHLRNITFRDAGLERELLALFGSRAATALTEIEQAGSEEERSAAAHRLSGAAKAIGANDLADAAEAIEESGTLTADNVGALSSAMAAVIAFLEGKLSQGADVSDAG